MWKYTLGIMFGRNYLILQTSRFGELEIHRVHKTQRGREYLRIKDGSFSHRTFWVDNLLEGFDNEDQSGFRYERLV